MRSNTLGSSIDSVVILTFMSLAFRNVTSAPLVNLDVVAPDGTVVGIIGENGSGKSRLLRLAAGVGRKHHAADGAHGPPRRWSRGDPARRDDRRERQADDGVAHRRARRGEGGGALSRSGAGSGGRHHDPHADRAKCLWHEYGIG